MSNVVEEAFAAVEGGRDALRKALGVSKQTLSDWKRWGHVSAKRAAAVEKITGIPRQRLCPEFPWGEADPAAAAPKRQKARR